MALVLADRVKETTTTTSTGTVTLLGASTGYQSFAAVGNGNTTYYCIAGQGTSEWEVGIGTYTSSGTTLSRDTVLASSNSGNLVVFSAGTKDVFVTYPAGKSVNQDASGIVTFTNPISTPSAFAFKNRIIGGDFAINPWQRGTTFTGIATGYCADRWSIGNGSDAVVNALKTADAPTATEAGVYTTSCLHIDVTTADTSIGAGQYFGVSQAFEGYTVASLGLGQTGTRYFTLSFWVKSTITGAYSISFRNSANNRSYIAEYTVNVTDTWEYKTLTIPVDTTGTWLYTTGIGMSMTFMLAGGNSFATPANTWTAGNLLVAGVNGVSTNQVNALSSASNNFKLALVQLEAGAIATPFDVRPYDTELRLCQRYYYRMYPNANNVQLCMSANNSTTVAFGSAPFPTQMRTAPASLDQSGTAAHYAVVASGAITACSAVPVINAFGTAYMGAASFTVASGLTSGQAGAIRTASSGGTAAYLGWSAEL